MTQKYNLEIKF